MPGGILNIEIQKKIETIYKETANLIETGDLKEAIEVIFDFIRYANKYFDTASPWVTRNTDMPECKNMIFNCIQIISNLSILLAPFLPFSSKKIANWLNITNDWKVQFIKPGYLIPETEILFERIDKFII